MQKKWSMMLLIGYILGTSLFLFHNIAQTRAAENRLTGTLAATLEDTWEDSQWQFFSIKAPLNQLIQINLTYKGDLDIDLWIFVDTNNTGAEQTINAWDITHCGLDRQPTQYSAIKTKETALNQPEQIIYKNIDFEVERIVYILIFVDKGIGTSEYTLTATTAIEQINENLEQCWTTIQAWTLFGIGCVTMFVIVVVIAKKKARTPEQKAAEQLKKDEKLKAKGKLKKTNMTSRRASR
jgi:hypothetical protein